MSYVDGFVIPIKKKNLKAYRKMATLGAKLWKKHGAVEYFECVGNDLKSKWGSAEFPKTVKVRQGETVVFSFIVFKSRAHRDNVNAKVMKDPVMNDPQYAGQAMPFDMKRMVFGGFKTIVEA
ncbi:MAG: DUF1428 domain-containing protein [Ignavibacteriae bacterium]|nr:DUF1428 domain-containing protein [Ignavibacteriota bacterium]